MSVKNGKYHRRIWGGTLLLSATALGGEVSRRPCYVQPERQLAEPGTAPTDQVFEIRGERVYDEQGIKAKKTELENKGLEVYRAPAGHYSLNVGVHSMFVYSVTQCLPLQKDMELRFAVKHSTSQHRPDGNDGLDVATGEARTAGTLSVFFAF